MVGWWNEITCAWCFFSQTVCTFKSCALRRNDSLPVNTMRGFLDMCNVAWSSTESISFRIIIRYSLAFSRLNSSHSRKQNNTAISTTWQRLAYLSEPRRSASQLYDPVQTVSARTRRYFPWSSNDSANPHSVSWSQDFLFWYMISSGGSTVRVWRYTTYCGQTVPLQTGYLSVNWSAGLQGRRPPLVSWWNWEGSLRSHIQHSFSAL